MTVGDRLTVKASHRRADTYLDGTTAPHHPRSGAVAARAVSPWGAYVEFAEMHADEELPDLRARRPDVVRRLMARGVPASALATILPEWEPFLADATRELQPL